MDEPAGLTVEGCRFRRKMLCRYLADEQLDAALICDRRHVHYLSGYWCPAVFASVLLVERDGTMRLVTPHPIASELAADVVLQYRAQRLATMIDDHLGAAIEQLAGRLSSCERIGVDGPVLPWARPGARWIDLRPRLLSMRRRKDADEIALLGRAIRATEAAYKYARGALRPGMTEVELFAGIQAAAAESAGEILGEAGNDFQIGSPGGPPRRRGCEAGEMAVLDLGVTLRGYRSDMCRSFVVGGEPTSDQLESRELLMAALAHVEQTARPGMSCGQLYSEVVQLLVNERGWEFPHHLGHGIGLSAHEAPRLNPEWDDTFEIGDVFTAEPGLYGDDLRAGPRIEEIYRMTKVGPEKLTSFPTTLF